MPQYRIKQIAEFNIASPTTNQTLRYDGSQWVNNSGLLIESDGDVTINGSLVVQGNYTVNGTTSTVNTENLLVEDPIILLSSTQSGSPTLDSGFFINRGTSATQSLLWDESEDQFAFISTSDSAETQGNVTIVGYSSLRVGGLQLTDGSESSGYFLVSDANGVGTWTSSSTSFDDLTDVSITGATLNDTLRYDGSQWVNSSEVLSHSDGTFSVSGRLGVGITNPTANLNTRGTILFESSSGTDRFILNDDGQSAFGAGVAASTSASFGHIWRSTGYSFGWGFYPNNATSAGVTVQMLGTTDIGISIANQGSPTGNVYGLQSQVFSTNASSNVGVQGNGRNGSSYNIGVEGVVSGGGSVEPSLYSIGVKGQVSWNLDGDSYGGHFRVIPTSAGVTYSNNSYYGVFAEAGGNYHQDSENLTFYAGRFQANGLLHNSTQYGVYADVDVGASYGTVSAVAGYFSSNADGVGSTNYAIIVPSGGGSVGIGTSTPTDTLHLTGTFRYVDGNESNNFILVSDANGVGSWTASSNVVSGDGNGIFDVTNDGGTVPSAFDTNLTDAWNINQPSSASAIVVRNITSGNANINLTSDATANGQAILRIDAQGTNRDAYIHFANSTTYATIGYDSSAGTFNLGTTSITTNTRFTMDPSTGKMGFGSGQIASTSGSAGMNFWTTGNTYGSSFRGTGTTNATMLVQPYTTTPWGIYALIDSNNTATGEVVAVNAVVNHTTSSTQVGVRGDARDGTTLSIGVDGIIQSDTQTSSNYKAGVRGRALIRENSIGIGGRFEAHYTDAATAFTNDIYGVYSTVDGTTGDAGSTGDRIAGYFESAGTAGSGSNYSIIVPSGGGNMGLGLDAPTELLHVDGNVRINDLLKIGTSGTSLTSTGVVTNMIASDSNTSTTTLTTVGVEMTINPSANNTSFFKAINGGIIKNGSTNVGTMWAVGGYARNSGTGNITNLIGVDGFAWSTNTSATITDLFGLRARPQTQGGTITNFGGLEVVLGQSSAGTITNMYGIHINTPVNTGATVSNTYGLRIDSNYTGSNNYGIYQSGTMSNYFGGNVGIATTSPTETLHVNGTFRLVDGSESDGFVLTSDANGVASWTASSGGGTDLTGLGVDNRIARWNGTDTIQSSDWFINDSGVLYPNTDGQDIGITGSNRIGNIYMSSRIDYASTGSGLSITEDEELRMIFDTSGNVTVGTGSLSQKFNVFGDINVENGGYYVDGVKVLDIEQGSTGNTVLGESAMNIDTISGAIRNTAIGYDAGSSISSGDSNTFVGWGAGRLIDTESNSTVIGALAMYSHTGQQSVAIGTAALDAAGSGSGNVAVGYQALSALASSDGGNIAIGVNAMFSAPDGAFNIAIGGSSGPDTSGGISNSISFGRSAIPNASNQGLMGGSLQSITDFIVGAGPTTIGTGAVTVRIHSTDIATGETDKSSGFTTILAGTRGTGTGTGGDLILQIAPPGSTGTAQNSYFDAITLEGDTGNVIIQSSGDSTLFNTDYTNDNIGIGIEALASTKVRIHANGNTSGDTALLVENDSGADILNILGDGQFIINSSGLPDADVTIEGDTDTVLFKTNASENSVGIGIAGQAASKLYVDATNEATKTYIASFASNVVPRGIFISTSANNATTYGVQISVGNTNASGTNYGVNSSATGNCANNYGIWARTGNGSTTNVAIWGQQVFAGGSGINAGVYGSDTSTGTIVKHGVYGAISGGNNATTTAYALRARNSSAADGSTNYGLHSEIVLGGGVTGSTNYAGYFDVTAVGAGNTNYGIVVGADLYSGFGTTTPEATLEINGQFFVEQVTDTVGATSVSIDWNDGNHTEIDLQPATGTVSAFLSNGNAGGWYTIKVIQGSGGHNIAWESNVKWGSGFTPTVTATDNAVDIFRFYYDGTDYHAAQTNRDSQ